MCGEAVPAGDFLAGMDFRLSMLERALACALDTAVSPGTVYVGLLEASGALRDFRLCAAALRALADDRFAAGRASVLAEQAAEAPPALRLVAGLDGG